MGGLVTDENDEWNLVRNRYPSGIYAKKFLDLAENLSAIYATIYIWAHISPPTAAVLNQFCSDYVSTLPIIMPASTKPGQQVLPLRQLIV